MDLSQFDTSGANEGAKMEVRDANGVPVLKTDGSPVTITLLGMDSDAYVKHENAATNRRLQQGTRAKLTAEGLKADAIAGLAKCTAAWDGFDQNGEPMPCTYENALALYTRYPVIRDQVSEFIADRANFLRTSPIS
jgi:hypothetical protein